jgi:hypothetical protein
MWSCIRRSQSADNNESSSVSLSRYRRTSNDNKPSFDGGSKQKKNGLRPAGAYQARTQTQETYKTHHATNPAKLKNNHRCQRQKTNITKTLITAFAGVMAYICTITGDQPWRQQKQRLME